jgi:PIN domain nuclease of toxin-antitoxin system
VSTVLDSSALLAIAFGEDGAEEAARAVPGGIMSAVNASEVVTKLVDLGAGGEEARQSLFAFGLTIRPFDAAQATEAGMLRAATRAQGLSLGDRACLALALREGARVMTADRAWAKLDLGVEVVLIR